MTALVLRLAAVVVALLIGGLAIQLTGRAALELGRQAIQSNFGTAYGRSQIAVLGTPLVLTGLAVSIAARYRLWNIGGEGQLFLGAWCAGAVGLFVDGPTPLILVLMMLAGAAGGTMWILIPALAKVYRDVNEIVTTLLLNFVAILLVTYFAIGPWRDEQAGFLQASRRVLYELPIVFNLHAGTLIAVALAVIMGVVFRWTRWGYESTIVGGNPRAAAFAGIPVKRRMLAAMLLSGAVAGFAGAVELAGTSHRLSPTISNEYGFIGIIVAVLAGFSPGVVVIVGYLFAGLLNAGITLQTQGLSVNAVLALTGLILLLVAAAEALARFRLVRAGASAPLRDAPGDATQRGA